MFTHQFLDLLLNLDDNWQVVNVEADYAISDHTCPKVLIFRANRFSTIYKSVINNILLTKNTVY